MMIIKEDGKMIIGKIFQNLENFGQLNDYNNIW